jgi:hypothetical protein
MPITLAMTMELQLALAEPSAILFRELRHPTLFLSPPLIVLPTPAPDWCSAHAPERSATATPASWRPATSDVLSFRPVEVHETMQRRRRVITGSPETQISFHTKTGFFFLRGLVDALCDNIFEFGLYTIYRYCCW